MSVVARARGKHRTAPRYQCQKKNMWEKSGRTLSPMRVIHLHTVVKAAKLSVICINFTPLNTARRAILDQGSNGKPKKYGANAPQLHHISCASAWGAILDQGSNGKIKKNYGANAPHLIF